MNPTDFAMAIRAKPLIGYLWAFFGTTLGSVVLSPFRSAIDLSNVALLYVLGVVVSAVSFGRGAAVATALYSALCFAYVFVPPHFSLAITELQHLLAALIMLVVALIVGHLTSQLKHHADESQRKTQSSRGLYLLAKELAGAQTEAEIFQITEKFLQAAMRAKAVRLIHPEEFNSLVSPIGPALVMQCLERRQLLSRPTQDGYFFAVLPLFAANGIQGVMGLEVEASALGSQAAIEHIETVASVVAVALERSSFAEMARSTEVKHAEEALRSSILSALSHDLRTPLAALVGIAETVSLGKVSPEKQRHMLDSLRQQALSISQQMTNLLEMARLRSGKLELNTAWQPVEEVLGATIQQIRTQARERQIDLSLEANLPPINVDAVLMERVFWNLLENALKYSPESEPVEISVRQHEKRMEICVCDRGPGVPAAQVELIFDTFQRGRQESEIPGVGLGLSIARTIIEAHGGELRYFPRPGGGSCFKASLPLAQIPAFESASEMR